MISSQKYWSKVYILQIWKKNCLIESWFFLIHIMNSKKQIKGCVSVLLFILYSIWVHVESPKYQTICHKSPKLSEFANFFKQKSVTMFISSCFNNYLIEFLKIRKLKKLKVTPRRDSNPQPLGLRLQNTCAIVCAKKTAENVFTSSCYFRAQKWSKSLLHIIGIKRKLHCRFQHYHWSCTQNYLSGR